MTFTQIEYFMKAYESRSISVAAEGLMVSRTAVSKAISHIEEELSTVLFDRAKEGVSPTEAGHFLYARLAMLNKNYSDLIRQLRDMTSEKNMAIRVGLIQTNINILYDLIFKEFAKKYRNIKVELVEGKWNDMPKMLAEGAVDVAFFPIRGELNEDERYPEFAKVRLFPNKILLAVSKAHPYAMKKIITAEDLLSVPLGYITGIMPGERVVTNICSTITGSMPNFALKTSSQVLLHRLTAEGELCTIIPQTIVPDWQDLKMIPINFTSNVYHYMCWRKNENMNISLINFVDFVCDHCDELTLA